MEINPEFKIGEKIFVKIDGRVGIIIGYLSDNKDLYYNVRFILNGNYNIGTFYSIELSRENNG